MKYLILTTSVTNQLLYNKVIIFEKETFPLGTVYFQLPSEGNISLRIDTGFNNFIDGGAFSRIFTGYINIYPIFNFNTMLH